MLSFFLSPLIRLDRIYIAACLLARSLTNVYTRRVQRGRVTIKGDAPAPPLSYPIL